MVKSEHRSFKAMAASPEIDVKKTDLWKVPPHMIEEEPGFNLRDQDDPEVIQHIESFAKSYQEGRYVPPLVLRVADDGRILVVEGHCRRRGALLAIERGAQIQYLEAVSFKGNDVERTEVMMRSAEGLKLKPLKIAEGYLRMLRWNIEPSEIAKRMNKTRQHVDQMLILAQANADVHQLVRDEKVSAAAAIDAVRQHGEKACQYLLGKLKDAPVRGGKRVVTQSQVKGWVPPRKVVSTICDSMNTVVGSLTKSARVELARFEKMKPEQLKGKTVQVDARALLALVAAHAKAEEVRSAKESKARDAAAKGAQTRIDEM
jgi:ParB family chromosome partitioning protein